MLSRYGFLYQQNYSAVCIERVFLRLVFSALSTAMILEREEEKCCMPVEKQPVTKDANSSKSEENVALCHRCRAWPFHFPEISFFQPHLATSIDGPGWCLSKYLNR